MLISLDELKRLYNFIIQNAIECEGQGCTTYIITANDTDSLCSLKILTVRIS